VADLKKEEARIIYRAEYWQALRLDAVLSLFIAAEIFDTAVNMGRTVAIKIVQEALNYFGEALVVDGLMGMKTLGALNQWCVRDERALYVCLNGFQFHRYVQIVENNATQKTLCPRLDEADSDISRDVKMKKKENRHELLRKDETGIFQCINGAASLYPAVPVRIRSDRAGLRPGSRRHIRRKTVKQP
jgi:hypothetical protein